MARNAPREPTTRSPSWAPSRWALWSSPRSACTFLLIAEATALVLTATLLTREPPTASILLRFSLLLCLGITYGEGAARSVRLQRYLGTDRVFANPMSVWSFAAVLTVPAGWAAAFVAAQYSHALWQRRRDASGKPYRVLFTAAATMLAQLSAAGLVDIGYNASPDSTIVAQLAAVAAAPLFLAVNMIVLLTGMWLSVRPPSIRSLVPDTDTLNYELGTLILGLAASQLVLHSILLTPIMLVPVALLHRGTVVKTLRHLARTDSKTGLLTASAWTENAGAALRRAHRSRSEMAVLLVDLDKFKGINDRHGHLAGDKVLAGVAECLRREVRGHEAAGRFGGEEFVITLEDVSKDAALTVAERLRGAISAITVAGDIHVTASIGLAHTGDVPPGTSIDTLVEHADHALYAAKAAGRNQVQAGQRRTRPVQQPRVR